MNNSYITIIKEKRTVLSRKRVPLNQNECTADFRIGVPFEQNLHFTLRHRSCNFQIGQQKIVEVLADRRWIINDFVVFLQQFLQSSGTKPAYLVIIQMQNNGLNLWIGTQKSCEGYGNFAVLHLFLWLIHTRKRKQTFRFVVLALAFQISGIGQQINGGFK